MARDEEDPFAVFGLTSAADLEALRSARRRLAMTEHPDRGGDPRRMQAINRAFDAAVAELVARARAAPPSAAPGPPEPADEPARRQGGRRSVERDEPSFVIEALPAEAFEALLIVANWLGEVILDDPPYLLEAHVDDPADCWCRLELLPEAGGTTVMLTVVGEEGVVPPVEAVRDRWIEQLNALGREPA